MKKTTQKHKKGLDIFLSKPKNKKDKNPYESFTVTKDGGFYVNPSEILNDPEIQKKMKESHKMLFPKRHKELFPEE